MHALGWSHGFLMLALAAPEPGFKVRMSDRATGAAVQRALARAAEALASEQCQRVLVQFRDESGRPLEAALDEVGYPAHRYLRLLIFYDGSRQSRCDDESVLAGTRVGGRVVWVCPQFREAARANPRLGAATVIHEMLHTLGLGENPPSSQEITARVRNACWL